MYKKYCIILVFSILARQMQAMEAELSALFSQLNAALKEDKQRGEFRELLGEFHELRALQSSEEKKFNRSNDDGHTALHLIVMHPDERSQLHSNVIAKLCTAAAKSCSVSSNLDDYEKEQVVLGAVAIKMGAKVDIKDKNGKTVSDIAEKNKDVLPRIYEVVMAGKVNQGINLASMDFSEATPEAFEVAGAYGSAQGTIDKYCPSDIKDIKTILKKCYSYMGDIKNNMKLS